MIQQWLTKAVILVDGPSGMVGPYGSVFVGVALRR